MTTTAAPKRGRPKGIKAEDLPILPDSTVIGLFGERGSGKSCAMAKFGIDAVDRGRKVFYYPASYGFKYGEPLPPKELTAIPEYLNGATLLIDEIQTLLSKFRMATTSSQMVMAFFQQLRKRGCDVVFTSNDPLGISSALSQQTDLHAYCKLYRDNRCIKAGKHMPSCGDTIVLRLVDTQGRYGFKRGSADGHKRMVVAFTRVRNLYSAYNTYGVADPAEVMAIDKKSVLESRAQDALGMTWEEFDDLLRDEVIPALVEQGFERLVPASFVKVLQKERPELTITPEQLGRRLRGLGLSKKHLNSGTAWILPRADNLQKWQMGLWSPDAEDA